MAGEWIRLQAADGHEFSAWLAKAEGPRRGGVIVAMEIFGVNGHIRSVTEGFAADGFDAIAPQLYDRAERDIDLAYDAAGVERGRSIRAEIGWDAPMLDLKACLKHLQAGAPELPVGIVGYCYGGALAWLAAAKVPGLVCAIGYYGTATLDMLDAMPQCPTMLHFGSRDASTPIDKIERLAERHPEVAIHLYEADHGFNSDRRANYDQASAELARERTLDFLNAHMD